MKSHSQVPIPHRYTSTVPRPPPDQHPLNKKDNEMETLKRGNLCHF